MGNPLIGPRFTASQLASPGHLARTLASGALGTQTDRALALLETSLVVAGEARELEVLLEGYRNAQSREAQQIYFRQAIRWMHSHGSQMERALEQMRWQYMKHSDRFEKTGSLSEQVLTILATAPASQLLTQPTTLSLMDGGPPPETTRSTPATQTATGAEAQTQTTQMRSAVEKASEIGSIRGPFSALRKGWGLRKLLTELEENVKGALTTNIGKNWQAAAGKVQEYIEGQPRGAIRKADQLKDKARAIAEMREHEVGSYAWVQRGVRLSLQKGPWHIVRGEKDLPQYVTKYVIQRDAKGYPRVRYGSAGHDEMVDSCQGKVIGSGWVRYNPASRKLIIDGKSRFSPEFDEPSKLQGVKAIWNGILGPDITIIIVPIVY